LLKIIRDTRVQIKYLKLLKNILEAFKKMKLAHRKMRIISRKIWKILGKP